MLTNKKRDMTPFDMSRKPVKQSPFLMPLIWGMSFVMTRKFGLKIIHRNMKQQDMKQRNRKQIKPPYLVISTHQGFSDYYIAPLALFPHQANYVSDMEGFAAFGEGLYRGIGCIGKRRYVSDYTVVRNIKYALEQGQSVVIFPESRHANVGTTAALPGNLGKLAKMMQVPVVMLSVHGSYLANPFWDEEHTRKTRMEATLECIYTKEQLESAAADEIQKTIEEKLQYDEYAWQLEQKIRISEPNRAEGLHKVLYQCPVCGKSFETESIGSSLRCRICDASWNLNEYGVLNRKCAQEDQTGCDPKNYVESEEGIWSNTDEVTIPDWYEWERAQTEQEIRQRIEQDSFEIPYKVRVEALPNAKGFVSLGEGDLILNQDAFILKMPDLKLSFPHKTRESVQTEYNYRGRGACIVLSNRDCCYYIYSEQKDFNPTKLQFAGEYLHQIEKEEKEK
ncbi:MAG: 1-acyl-sn-glycerol-3-phosphate acyltransferase [bacterium]|nr:1-acyl-sn-glycerol-3-phosphate acyltransferase [bacterium]